jgi:acyl transferase domain-containing protein
MTTRFEPIAIIGQSCVLPGALSPAALWEIFRTGTDATSTCPEGRWRLAREDVLRQPGQSPADGAVSDRGGYVRGFEQVFRPDGFALPVGQIRTFDPAVHWLLHTGREALRSARLLEGEQRKGLRIGACLGNLSFPTDSLGRWTEACWLDAQGVDFLGGRCRELAGLERPAPANRFMSGLPALLLAEALQLDAGAFALDAACASSLYAIKLACDRLQDRRADAMLAGAVCCCDDLFIHVGFTALQALSPSGRSRPFHRGADGLLPAEGAALLVLKRLDDALGAGDPILGVLRGVGLSNDGRSNGLLVPSAKAQVRAIRQALDVAGLEPRDISLLECHATGTPVGDATEIESMGEVYRGLSNVPIGSAKSNLGHALTVAGAAGIMKVLGAMGEKLRPPSLNADEPLAALSASPFRLLAKAEPWNAEGPRRAGVSAFGFGGNNAHVIVEEWAPARRTSVSVPAPVAVDVAIVAVGACVADGKDARDFTEALLTNSLRVKEASQVELPLEGLRFPPADLSQTLAQQLLVLRAAGEAIGSLRALPAERTGVYVGMQCDAVVARGGVRARLAEFTRAWEMAREAPPPGWLGQARTAAGEPLTAAGVVGKMPNIVTNRINRQFDLAGPSFSVFSEETSGLDALEIGRRALTAGEIDAAVIGAVDLSCEPAHEAAARAVLPPDRQVPGDAAVALVLKRLTDARRDGDEVLAILGSEHIEAPGQQLGLGGEGRSFTSLFGHAHAASGLLHVAAGAIAARHRLRWSDSTGAPGPWPTTAPAPSIAVSVTPMLGPSRKVTLHVDRDTAPRSAWPADAPTLHVYSGADRRDVLRRLAAGRSSNDGPSRLVLLATEAQLLAKAEEARRLIEGNVVAIKGLRLADGIYFRERPIEGELGFVFTGPAGAYAGMGHDLLLAFPELTDRLTRFGALDDAFDWVFSNRDAAAISSNDKLWGASYLTQLHAIFTREIVGLSPQAAIGFCSGETNALFAMGAWHDMSRLREEILAEKVYEREIGGEFAVAHRDWEKRGLGPSSWETWRIAAPEDKVRAALSRETDAHLTIVNAPGDFIVAGRAEACARVVASVGAETAQPLGYNVTIHSPEMEGYAETWRRLHHRATRPVPGVRFYTHSTCSSYQPTADSVADALLGQALHTVDFPKLIRRAWDDGVRVFVEHGPQGGCSSWIRRTLGDREHLAVPLDLRGESSFFQPLRTIAELVAAGVPVDVDRFNQRLSQLRSPRPAPKRQLSWPAHPPPIRLPAIPKTAAAVTPQIHRMPLPPWVPSILEDAVSESPSAIPATISAPAVSAPAASAGGPSQLLVERFQQHATALSKAHQKFVSTAEGAFQPVSRLCNSSARGQLSGGDKPSTARGWVESPTSNTRSS